MIKMLDNNELDMNKLEIKDIMDINMLQRFQDDFALAMNCASATLDNDGNLITKASGYTRFCYNIQSTKKGADRCAASNKMMWEEAIRTGKAFVGKCHAGLVDFVVPIIIEGKLLGSIFGGQMLDDSVKKNDFIQIAKEIDMNSDSLIESVNEVSIVDFKSIEAAANVLFTVVNALAKNGYNQIKLDMVSKRLANNFMQVSATIEELSASALNITSQQEELNSEITQVEVVTKQINSTLDAIKTLATQIKMLGLNTSIESARAGNAGKGFLVIAKEIKNLAENSKKTAHSISDLTTKIQESVTGTIKNSNITLKTTKEQSTAMEEVSKSIQDSVHIVDQLNNMMEDLK